MWGEKSLGETQEIPLYIPDPLDLSPIYDNQTGLASPLANPVGSPVARQVYEDLTKDALPTLKGFGAEKVADWAHVYDTPGRANPMHSLPSHLLTSPMHLPLASNFQSPATFDRTVPGAATPGSSDTMTKAAEKMKHLQQKTEGACVIHNQLIPLSIRALNST